MNVSVIYYSSTGTNHQLAEAVVAGAEETGAEVRLRRVAELAPPEAVNSRPDWKAHLESTRHIPEATLDDLDWADALVFGTPTRYGNVAAQLKQFLDSTGPLWVEGRLANKVAAGFTSAQNRHGGQEATLLSLYQTMMHWGCILATPGYTDPVMFAAGGNPYGISATASDEAIADPVLSGARYLGKRVATVAGWIVRGRD